MKNLKKINQIKSEIKNYQTKRQDLENRIIMVGNIIGEIENIPFQIEVLNEVIMDKIKQLTTLIEGGN